MSDELQDYKIQEAINQGKLNEATIGSHGIRIGQIENDCKNMQRTVIMSEKSQESITKCEKRLDEYDTWRRSLLWGFGKIGVSIMTLGGVIGFFLTLVYVKR